MSGMLIARRLVPGQPKLRVASGALHSMVALDEGGMARGHIDFEALERSNRALTDVWVRHHSESQITASGFWPENLGGQAAMFYVESDKAGRITALVHRKSGFRRERVAVEDAINRRKEAALNAAVRAGGVPVADIRDLVGGSRKPLRLDADGRTVARRTRAIPAFPTLRRAHMK